MSTARRMLLPQSQEIKIALIKKGMTQRELAKAIGMNENYLTDVIAGRKAGTKYLNEIKEILEISL